MSIIRECDYLIALFKRYRGTEFDVEDVDQTLSIIRARAVELEQTVRDLKEARASITDAVTSLHECQNKNTLHYIVDR